jgi:hypothetical protein
MCRDIAIKGMIVINTCYTRASVSVPVSDDTGHDKNVGQQVTAKDGEAHQGHPISDAGVRVRFLA